MWLIENLKKKNSKETMQFSDRPSQFALTLFSLIAARNPLRSSHSFSNVHLHSDRIVPLFVVYFDAMDNADRISLSEAHILHLWIEVTDSV